MGYRHIVSHDPGKTQGVLLPGKKEVQNNGAKGGAGQKTGKHDPDRGSTESRVNQMRGVVNKKRQRLGILQKSKGVLNKDARRKGFSKWGKENEDHKTFMREGGLDKKKVGGVW